MYFVYIIRSEDNRLYIGITLDLSQRIETHRSGKGAEFTKVHPKEPLNNKLYNLGNVAQPPPSVYRGKPQPGAAVPHIKLVNVIYFQALTQPSHFF